MSEYTNEELAEAVDRAAGYFSGENNRVLRAAGHALRSLQAKEQETQERERLQRRLAGRERKPLDPADIGIPHLDESVPAADPPPPEDALLAIEVALNRIGDPPYGMPEVRAALLASRDRIAELSETDMNKALAKIRDYVASQNSRIAAAEARAQGLEAALRPLADAVCKVLDRYDAKSTVWQDMWEPWKAANAALARPEPEGK